MAVVINGFHVSRHRNIFSLVALRLIFAFGPAGFAQTDAVVSASATQAENTGNELSRFEVATIKPIDPRGGAMVGANVYPGGRVLITGEPLKNLIQIAFDLSWWQISGGEEWVSKDIYDLEAKPFESARSSITNLRYSLFAIDDVHLRQMLQALLIDRFQLKFHRETKTGSVFLLERSGKPLQLHPTDAVSAEHPYSGSGSIGWAGSWNLSNTTMPQLAKVASDFEFHCPVFDKTGLNGTFNFRSRTSQNQAELEGDGDVNSFVAFVKEAGLQLKSTKGPVDTFVIDHAEEPSPN